MKNTIPTTTRSTASPQDCSLPLIMNSLLLLSQPTVNSCDHQDEPGQQKASILFRTMSIGSACRFLDGGHGVPYTARHQFSHVCRTDERLALGDQITSAISDCQHLTDCGLNRRSLSLKLERMTQQHGSGKNSTE